MSYWSKRQEKLNKALEKDEEALKKRLNRIYEEEARKLQKEIAAYYEMYGEEDVIEYRKLLEELSAEDRRLLIEDMEEFARKYPKYKHLLPVRESIYKLDRLQGLQESVRLQQMRIGAQEEELIREHLVRTAYRGANASAEAMGFGSAFYSMNEDIVKKFVDVPWSDGKSFSERIWENKEKLTNFLNKDIAQGMARGDSYANLTKHLMERMGDVSRRDAYRLVYTEGTYVHAEASITPFEEDFEYYKLSTVGDRKVCSICKGLEDAEPVPISKRVPGENFPPLHPWCRCTFTIEVENWDAWMDDYVAKHGPRAAEGAEEIAENLSVDDGFFTKHDPMREKTGSAKESNPKELEELKKKIRDFGVEIDEFGTDMKYGPSAEIGKPGRLSIDPEASFSAWLHEYKHIEDDAASGWKGMLVLMNTEEAIRWEDAAYDVEIDYALSLGYNKIASRLKYLKGERRKELHGKRDLKETK